MVQLLYLVTGPKISLVSRLSDPSYKAILFTCFTLKFFLCHVILRLSSLRQATPSTHVWKCPVVAEACPWAWQAAVLLISYLSWINRTNGRIEICHFCSVLDCVTGAYKWRKGLSEFWSEVKTSHLEYILAIHPISPLPREVNKLVFINGTTKMLGIPKTCPDYKTLLRGLGDLTCWTDFNHWGK